MFYFLGNSRKDKGNTKSFVIWSLFGFAHIFKKCITEETKARNCLLVYMSSCAVFSEQIRFWSFPRGFSKEKEFRVGVDGSAERY